MSDLKVVSTSYMKLEFKNSINFLCLKEGIKQFGHLCNWELGLASSLEVKIIKEPLRRQLLETKLKIVSTGVHLKVVHMSYPVWRAVYDYCLRVNGSVERKSLHAFNLIGFEAIRITIWPKRTKIAPTFFRGKSSTTLALSPMLNCSVRSSGMRRGQNFAFPSFCFNFSPCFLVGNVFAKIP